MRNWRYLWVGLTCAALLPLLLSCSSAPPENPYTSEYYTGGVKLLSWTGVVKGRVTILCSPNAIDLRRSFGSRAKEVRQKLHNPMPKRPGICYLDIQQSPGFINIIEQPARLNNYTCEIRINHTGDEAERYNFNLLFVGQGKPE